MDIEVKLPELGDGITSGDILEVLVRVGDHVIKDQGILEVETDKATVTLPSSHAGRVKSIHVQPGETVPIGKTVLTLTATAGAASRASAAKPSAPAKAPAPPEAPKRAEPSVTTAPVATQLEPAPVAAQLATSRPSASPAAPVVAEESVAEASAENGGALPAGPAVRRFAREVGVDLRNVTGTADGHRITREDVLDAVRQANQVVRSGGAASPATPTAASGEHDGWGPVRSEKMTKIRKTIAAKMHASWTTVPRVTNHDDADVTELERIRQASKEDYAARGIKLTSLPFVIKSLAMALRSHPIMNASIDLENGTIIYKDYVNIGLAVESDRGLVVPSLRNADQISIPEIARQVATLADKVRTGDFSVDDLRGSTFTVSNLGAIGGTYSTPIINTPEVAILLIGRSRKLPVVVDDEIVPRLMMPLSLSYDHRLVDGGTAARFLNDILGYLKAPGRLLLAP